MSDNVNLKRLFADICKQFTLVTNKNRSIYIKHLNHFDQTDIDCERERYFEDAQRNKIPTLKEKLEWLDSAGLWSKKNEQELNQQKIYIDNLEKTQKQVLALQRKEIEKTLKEARIKYNSLFSEKYKLIGLTCEQYADEKIQNQYILKSLYCDEKLSQPFFDTKEFDEIEDDELGEYITIYLQFINKFSHNNIKKISVADFFTSYYYLSDDHVNFFGVPVVQMSFYQLNLLSYASYYKHIIRNNKIPENARENPDQIEEYANKSQVVQKTLSKHKQKDNARVGMVGMTAEDYEMAGITKGNLKNTLFKNGEITNINDAVKILGD